MYNLNWPILLIHGITNEKCDCGKEDCSSPGKHPIAKNGVYSAKKVSPVELLEGHPNANIALATGKPSNIVVLDIDGNEGKKSLMYLLGKYGDWEPTVCSQTGSGYHYFFQAPPGGLKNSVSSVATELFAVIGPAPTLVADAFVNVQFESVFS